jgi:hypothetical protein
MTFDANLLARYATPEKVPGIPKYFSGTQMEPEARPGIWHWAGFQVFDFAASPAVPC